MWHSEGYAKSKVQLCLHCWLIPVITEEDDGIHMRRLLSLSILRDVAVPDRGNLRRFLEGDKPAGFTTIPMQSLVAFGSLRDHSRCMM